MRSILMALFVLVLTIPLQAILDDGLVAHYTFDGNTNDSSIYSNDATIYGNVQLTEGRFGQAYLFDGVDGSIEAPHSSSLDITGPITVSCWVKAQDTYWRSGLVIKAPDYSPVIGYNLRIIDNVGKLTLSYTSGSSHAGETVQSDTEITDNNWHLVTASYDGDVMRMYIDGELESSVAYTAGYESNTADLQIGHYYYPYSDLWGPDHEGRNNVTLNGAIDDVGIWNRALTDSEILYIYNNPIPEPATLSLLAIGGAAMLRKRKA